MGKPTGLAGAIILGTDMPIPLVVALARAEGPLGVRAGLALVELEADCSPTQGSDELGGNLSYGFVTVGFGSFYSLSYLVLSLELLGVAVGPVAVAVAASGVVGVVANCLGLEAAPVAGVASAASVSASAAPVVVGVEALVVGVGDEHLGLEQVGQSQGGGGMVCVF